MSDADLAVEIETLDVSKWLSTDLPAWATRTRFHARLVDREGVIVVTAKDTSGAVGYAVFAMIPRKRSPAARPSAA